MKSSRLTLIVSIITTLTCLIILIVLYAIGDLDNYLIMFIKDIMLAIFSGSFMTIVFSYIQMKVFEQELLIRFQNNLIKIIETCNITYRNQYDYENNEECLKSYKELKKIKEDVFLISIELREIYYYVNIKTKNNDILAVSECVKYIIKFMKNMNDYFMYFKISDDKKEWKKIDKEKLLRFNNILWYENNAELNEEEIQEIADKSSAIGYSLDNDSLYYNKIFYDIMEIYPKLKNVYNFDL